MEWRVLRNTPCAVSDAHGSDPIRNVFDQYQSVENRITHALATSLAEDRRLLHSFLADVGRCTPPRGIPLIVEEQKIPGELELPEQEAEARGLPDIWIHDDENWAFLIESKVTAAVRADQIRRHLATAARRGFGSARALLISARPHRVDLPDHVRTTSWKAIYSWLQRNRLHSDWAERTATFLEIEEARMAEREGSFDGSLTEFTGFHFGPDRPYEYGEAKRVLRLAMAELRERTDLRKQLKIDPSGKGHRAITGRKAYLVWDFLPLRAARDAHRFTLYPHLTLALQINRVLVHATVPNGLSPPFRRRLLGLSFEEFSSLLRQIERRLRPVVRSAPGAAPWFVGLQRHYRSQNAEPTDDARIEFDLRTIIPSASGKRTVKAQPVLLHTAYKALHNRRPNYQMAVGLLMPYRECKAVRSPRVLDLIARTWIGCKPMIDAVLSNR